MRSRFSAEKISFDLGISGCLLVSIERVVTGRDVLGRALLAIVGIPVDLVLVIVVAPPAGQDGTRDVVPHGEEGGRHGGNRLEAKEVRARVAPRAESCMPTSKVMAFCCA